MDGETLTDLTLFKPLDATKFANRLKLDARGEERGKAGLPATTASDLDEVETDVVANVVAEHTQQRNDALMRLRELNELITQARASLVTTDLENRVAPMVAAIEQRASVDLPDLQHRYERLAEDRKAFQEWRRKRRLTRPAKEPKSAFGFFADLYVIAIAEGGANLFFFTEGNAAGLVGAFFQALLIAAANILMCSVVGFSLVKRVNSVFLINKLLGGIAVLALIVGLPVVHIVVGFYRVAHASAVEAVDGSSALWIAIQWAVDREFHRLDELSIVMIVVGVIAGAYAARKGYEFGDRYPDYTKRYNESEEHRNAYLDSLEGITSDMLAEQEAASKAISVFLYEVKPALEAVDRHTDRKRELAAALKGYEEHLEVVLNALVSRYRDANRKARSTPAPAHFNARPKLPNRVFVDNAVHDAEFKGLFAVHVDVDGAHRAAVQAKASAEAQLARIQSITEATRRQLKQGEGLRDDD